MFSRWCALVCGCSGTACLCNTRGSLFKLEADMQRLHGMSDDEQKPEISKPVYNRTLSAACSINMQSITHPINFSLPLISLQEHDPFEKRKS